MIRHRSSASDADAPLNGKAPAAGQLRDTKPEGETPNDSYHPNDAQVGKDRPQQYPVAKDDGIAQANGLKSRSAKSR
ncbi:MAG: hypothetical protein JF571_07790 [Asticcacaulis sp.]|nr:hypothetical protein [Asticcacaulis sp.]